MSETEDRLRRETYNLAFRALMRIVPLRQYSAEAMLYNYIGFRRCGMDRVQAETETYEMLRAIDQPFDEDALGRAIAGAEADFVAAGSPASPPEPERVEYPEYRQRPHRHPKRRPVILSGHPDFNDPYGVDQVATPRDVYLDDRFMLGKEVGS